MAQGYNGREKPFITDNTATLRASSIRLILSMASNNDSMLFSQDVTQADLQSKQNLTRKVYIKVKKADLESFGMQCGTLLRFRKPLYGICDASDY